MSEAKREAEVWSVGKVDLEGRRWVIGPGGDIVCRVGPTDGNREAVEPGSEGRRDARARLIASAPKMADEIERLRAEVKRLKGREAALVAACRSAFEAFSYQRCDVMGADAYRCSACERTAHRIEGFPHYDDCAWVMTGEALDEWLPLADRDEEAKMS